MAVRKARLSASASRLSSTRCAGAGKNPPPERDMLVASLESQARYIIRPALAIDALEKRDNGSLAMQTPPDPRTGATILVFDSLEWIYRVNPRSRPTQSKVPWAYSKRARVSAKSAQDFAESTAQTRPADEDSDFAREARRIWARLLWIIPGDFHPNRCYPALTWKSELLASKPSGRGTLHAVDMSCWLVGICGGSNLWKFPRESSVLAGLSG
jgi:hypothetical protein